VQHAWLALWSCDRCHRDDTRTHRLPYSREPLADPPQLPTVKCPIILTSISSDSDTSWSLTALYVTAAEEGRIASIAETPGCSERKWDKIRCLPHKAQTKMVVLSVGVGPHFLRWASDEHKHRARGVFRSSHHKCRELDNLNVLALPWPVERLRLGSRAPRYSSSPNEGYLTSTFSRPKRQGIHGLNTILPFTSDDPTRNTRWWTALPGERGSLSTQGVPLTRLLIFTPTPTIAVRSRRCYFLFWSAAVASVGSLQ